MTDHTAEPIARTAFGDRQISRRRAIRAAAATGVGVAAWATPGLSSIGTTPVYAAACSPGAPVEYAEDGGGNTNCGRACADFESIGWLGAGNNRRNISGPGFSGSLMFVPAPPECSQVPRAVTIVATRDSDGATLDCVLTGVNIEAINNSEPVPATPDGEMPQIRNGYPAPPEFCGSGNPYVDCSDPMNPVWRGINKNNGIGNICSSQWGIVMECVVVC